MLKPSPCVPQTLYESVQLRCRRRFCCGSNMVVCGTCCKFWGRPAAAIATTWTYKKQHSILIAQVFNLLAHFYKVSEDYVWLQHKVLFLLNLFVWDELILQLYFKTIDFFFFFHNKWYQTSLIFCVFKGGGGFNMFFVTFLFVESVLIWKHFRMSSFLNYRNQRPALKNVDTQKKKKTISHLAEFWVNKVYRN